MKSLQETRIRNDLRLKGSPHHLGRLKLLTRSAQPLALHRRPYPAGLGGVEAVADAVPGGEVAVRPFDPRGWGDVLSPCVAVTSYVCGCH